MLEDRPSNWNTTKLLEIRNVLVGTIVLRPRTPSPRSERATFHATFIFGSSRCTFASNGRHRSPSPAHQRRLSPDIGCETELGRHERRGSSSIVKYGPVCHDVSEPMSRTTSRIVVPIQIGPILLQRKCVHPIAIPKQNWHGYSSGGEFTSFLSDFRVSILSVFICILVCVRTKWCTTVHVCLPIYINGN